MREIRSDMHANDFSLPKLCVKPTMAEAPAADDTLTEGDAGQIARELNEAQNESFSLGLELKLPPHEVEAICQQYQKPRDRLARVIIAFLRQTERPKWRVIVEALRSPAVGRPDLASRVEAAHFPDPTAARDVVPAPVDTESAANTTATGDDDDEVKSTTSSQQPSPAPDSSAVEALQGEIKGFNQRFISITVSTIECLENCCITVVAVVFLLTSALSECKDVLEEKCKALRKSEDHLELFTKLNLYWNYLSFGLLHGLIDNLFERNEAFEKNKEEMEKYSQDMQKFRARTKLVLFCEVDYSMLAINPLLQPCDPPPGFRKMVTKHQWPGTVTLKDVEEFRKQFLLTFRLPECAIMVNRIRRKCFVITWFGVLPTNVIQLLSQSKGKIEVFTKFKVTSVEIDDEIVYRPPSQLPRPVSYSTASTVTDIPATEFTSLDIPATEFTSLGDEPSFSSESSHYRGKKRYRLPDISTGKKEEVDIPAAKFTSLDMPAAKFTSLGGKPSFSSESSHYRGKERFSTAKKETVDPRKLLTVQCHGKKRAPCEMHRGSATTDGRFAYFTPRHSNSLYQYEYSTEKWEKLPACPYDNSGLVVIDRELTAVGGLDGSYRCTNKLYTLRQRKWVEKYPPMNTAHSHLAVVSTSDGEHLIVIGGLGGDWTATVELFQVKSRKWYQLTDLPQHLTTPSATICGDLLHVIGNGAKGYSCSLHSLPSSGDQPIPPQSLSWTPLPPLPVEWSTPATLCGQLVLISGAQDWLRVNSIHQLVDGQWVEIGSMASARGVCLVVSPSPDKIIIVGGLGAEDSVEECVAMT